jgi:hypothetical protein
MHKLDKKHTQKGNTRQQTKHTHTHALIFVYKKRWSQSPHTHANKWEQLHHVTGIDAQKKKVQSG